MIGEAHWQQLYEAVLAGGSGATEPDEYYEGVTDAVAVVLGQALAEQRARLRSQVEALPGPTYAEDGEPVEPDSPFYGLVHKRDVLALLREPDGRITFTPEALREDATPHESAGGSGVTRTPRDAGALAAGDPAGIDPPAEDSDA